MLAQSIISRGLQLLGWQSSRGAGLAGQSIVVDGQGAVDIKDTLESLDRSNTFYALNLPAVGSLVSSPPGNMTTWMVSTSTYCGLGCLLPATATFNRVVFPLIAWNNASIPTRCRIVIKQTNVNGAVLATITKTLPPPTSDTTSNATAFQMFTVSATLPVVIPGAAADKYWFEVYVDGYAGLQNTNTNNVAGTNNLYVTSNNPNYLTALVANSLGTTRYPNISFYLNSVVSAFEQVADNGMKNIPPGYTTGNTFSSFAFGLGNNLPAQTGGLFNAIEVDLIYNNAAANPPANVRCILRDGGATLPGSNPTSGAVLGDVTVPLNFTTFQIGRPFSVIAIFSAADITTSNYLWLEIIADGHIGFRSSTCGGSLPSYGANYMYGVPATPALTTEPNNTGGANLGLWFKTFAYSRSTMVLAPVVGTSAITQYWALQQAYLLSDFNTITNSMPSQIYAMTGVERRIYFRNFIRAGLDLRNYAFSVQTTPNKTSSQLFTDSWAWTPVDGDAGTVVWTLTIRKNNVLLATITTNIVCLASTAGGSATRQIITIGDSRTFGGTSLAQMMYRLESFSNYTLTTLGETSVTSIDSAGGSHTLNTDSLNGKTYLFHITDPASHFCKHTAIAITSGGGSGASTVTLASVVGIVAGTWVTLSQNDGVTGNELCLVLSIAGSVLTLTQPVVTAGHTTAYWFSFQAYLTANSYTFNSGDIVQFRLGTNDEDAPTTDQALYGLIGLQKLLIQSAVNNILSVQAGAKLEIQQTESTPDQDSYGAAGLLSTYQTSQLWNHNYEVWREWLLTGFPGQARVAIYPGHLGLDTVHNYPLKAYSWNADKPIVQVTVTQQTIAAGANYQPSVVVAPDVTTNWGGYVCPPKNHTPGIIVTAYCATDNQVQFVFTNATSGSLTLQAGTYVALSHLSQVLIAGNNSVHQGVAGYWQSGDQDAMQRIGVA